MTRPLVAEIDLPAVRHNFIQAQRRSAGARIAAVVKGDGYGHGAVAIAEALRDLASAYAVISLDEAEQLYISGLRKPVVVLQGFFEEAEIACIASRDYQCVVHSEWQVSMLERWCRSLQSKLAAQRLKVWLKVDTGMHRLGISVPYAARLYGHLSRLPGVEIVALTTHLACADEGDNELTAQQIARIRELGQSLKCPISYANSAGVLRWLGEAASEWLRPGIMLYGSSPFAAGDTAADVLDPVMTLKSKRISVREIAAGESVGYGARFVAQRPTLIDSIACGYGDGYPRHAADGTPELVNGVRCSLAGRVSMDTMTVDLTAVPVAQPGDSVELWGKRLKATEVAEHCGTISYTLFTGLLPRVPRRYIQAAAANRGKATPASVFLDETILC